MIFVPTSAQGCGKRCLRELPAGLARWRRLTRFHPPYPRGGLSPRLSHRSPKKPFPRHRQRREKGRGAREGGGGGEYRSIFKEIFVDLQRHYRCGARVRVNRFLRAYGDAVKGAVNPLFTRACEPTGRRSSRHTGELRDRRFCAPRRLINIYLEPARSNTPIKLITRRDKNRPGYRELICSAAIGGSSSPVLIQIWTTSASMRRIPINPSTCITQPNVSL